MANITLLLLTLLSAPAIQDPSGPLVIFNAGSLAAPLREVMAAFRARYPAVDPRGETSGSVEVARKLTEFGKIPDVVAVADGAVIDQLLIPRFTPGYLIFASNAMVVAYTDRSAGAREITRANWTDVLRRSGVRVGRSDPAQDPGGYRAVMTFQLAERHYRRPGLAGQLLAASPDRYTRPKEVELVALLETGNIDYAIFYRTVAQRAGFKWIDLPPEIDLSDPAHAAFYREAEVVIPRSRRTAAAGDLRFRGEPIAYGVTIPTAAPNPVAARAFVRFLLGAQGRAILRREGFVLPDRPALGGDTAWARSLLPPRAG